MAYKPTIAVDLDNVLFGNFLSELLSRYNQMYGGNLREQDIDNYDFANLLCDECGNIFDLCDVDFFDKIEISESAHNFINWAFFAYNVVFVTAGSIESLRARADRLQKEFYWFTDGMLIHAVDKGRIRADYLIDDDPCQLTAFRSGTTICLEKPWNKRIFSDFYTKDLWEARDIIYNEEMRIANGE